MSTAATGMKTGIVTALIETNACTARVSATGRITPEAGESPEVGFF